MDFIGGDFTTIEHFEVQVMLYNFVYSDRFMLTPVAVSVDTMQWQCRCVGLYLAARDHFSMTRHILGA